MLAARRLHGLPVPRMGGVAIASDRDAERASVPGWGVCKSRAGHWSTIRSTAPCPRGQVSYRAASGPLLTLPRGRASAAVKQIASPYAIVLTGTPLETKPDTPLLEE